MKTQRDELKRQLSQPAPAADPNRAAHPNCGIQPTMHHRNTKAKAQRIEKKLLPLVKSPYLHHTWNFAHSAFALALIYHARGRADEANEIADKLFISITTVKSHIQNIYGKLDVSKRREAVEKAMKIGILSI